MSALSAFCFRCALLGAVLLLAGCLWEPSHEPDAVHLQRFQKYRPTLEKLVGMIEEDPKLERVDEDWTRPDPAPVSPARLQEYRRLLKSVGCRRGFGFGPNAEIQFLASVKGLVLSGSAKGYAYSEHPLEPLVENIDTFRREPSKEPLWIFRHIEGPWYLFFEIEG